MLDKVKEYLQVHDVYPSMQRIVIMNYLFNHRTHPTVDMIYNDISKSMPTLSRTTVYNTLKVLVNHNAVLQLDIDEKELHYDGYTHVHAHFRCLSCGKIINLSPKYLDKLATNEIDDLIITETQLYYKGYCSDCKKNGKLPNIDNKKKLL